MKFRLFVKGAIALACLLCSGCGDDGPTKPSEPRLPKFYFNNAGNWNCLYAYDLKTDSVTTIVLPLLGPLGGTPIFGSLAGSSRRHRLYLGDHSRTGVYDLDKDSLIDVRYIGSNFGIAVSPDEQMLALCGDSLMVVRSSDFSVVFHDSARAANPVFSRDGRTLFAAEQRAGAYAFIIRFSGDSVSCERHSFPSPLWKIRPSVDNELWFIYVSLGNYQFGVGAYDPAKDSLVSKTTTIPGVGDMVCTPDGRSLIYSSPGFYLSFGSNPLGFFIVDLTNNFHETKVSTAELTDQLDSMYVGFRPGKMALSVNGRYLAAAPPENAGAFIIYDMWTMKIVRCWNFQRELRNSAFWDVACID